MTSNPCSDGIAHKSAMPNTLTFEDVEFPIREDGCWDATRMCQKYGKRINNFLRNESIQRYLNALSKRVNIPVESEEGEALIYKSKGGDTTESGTWVHQRVALRLAAWLNEDFEVWVYDMVEKLLTKGSVLLEEENEGLRQALKLTDEKLTEVNNELVLTEHQLDRMRYQLDSVSDELHWRQSGCPDNRDLLEDDEEEDADELLSPCLH